MMAARSSIAVRRISSICLYNSARASPVLRSNSAPARCASLADRSASSRAELIARCRSAITRSSGLNSSRFNMPVRSKTKKITQTTDKSGSTKPLFYIGRPPRIRLSCSGSAGALAKAAAPRLPAFTRSRAVPAALLYRWGPCSGTPTSGRGPPQPRRMRLRHARQRTDSSYLRGRQNINLYHSATPQGNGRQEQLAPGKCPLDARIWFLRWL